MVLRPRGEGKKFLFQYLVPLVKIALSSGLKPFDCMLIFFRVNGQIPTAILAGPTFETRKIGYEHTYYELMDRSVAKAKGAMVVRTSCDLLHEIYQTMFKLG